MKKFKMKLPELHATQFLSRAQMKNVMGGGGLPKPKPCFRCCPNDPCASHPIYCTQSTCIE